ncbi:MAG: 50S ribosomal protein L4 [Verrucomicrobiales bacterium]|nr:50S ribosomal protein L4 [Verrucomicrobiales bacterium]MCP5528647.1 50S ribosomal protein L4 [Verrucomicrobiales bacterium]
MKLAVRDQQGKAAGEIDAGFELIEGGKGTQAVHDAVVGYLANQRHGTACAKTKSEVAGSGKKPWRQKGTGRARAGNRRSPLWPGGGVVFGPRPRDYSKKVGKRTRVLALRKALTERMRAGDVVLLSELKLDTPKTKGFIAVLGALELDGTVLLVQAGNDENLLLASRNVPGVEVTTGDLVNAYELLRFDKLVFTQAAWELVAQRLN